MKKFKLKKQLDSALMVIVEIGIAKKDDDSFLVIELRDKNPRSPKSYLMSYDLDCIAGDLNGVVEHDTIIFDIFTHLRFAHISEIDKKNKTSILLPDSSPASQKVIKTVFDYFIHHQPQFLTVLRETGAIDELFLYLFCEIFDLIGGADQNNYSLVDTSNLLQTRIATPSVVRKHIENIMSIYCRYSPVFNARKGYEGYLDQVFWNYLQCLTSCSSISFENKNKKALSHYLDLGLPFNYERMLSVLDVSMNYFDPSQIHYELRALTNVSIDFPDAISCQNTNDLIAALKNRESSNKLHNVWLRRDAKAYFLHDSFLGINADGSCNLDVDVFILCRILISATYRNYMIDKLNDQIILDVVKHTSHAVDNLSQRWMVKGEVEPEEVILGGLYKLKLFKSKGSGKQVGLIITIDDRILNALPDDLVVS